ncbi:MAG: hypothetical protein Q8904_06335 [Bacteroidota bacterium]|nr:hypothetical protein [Bacteroidota bacterium]
MKQSVKFFLVTVFFLFVLASCDYVREIFSFGKPELTFKASPASETNPNDTILFTGNDIKWINGTTGEICFVNSLTISKIKSYHRIRCYLGTDSLFSATVTLPAVSPIINDLVMNLNLNDGHFYFEDGYPDWIDNLGTNSIRIQNKQKRAAAWNRFIDELKKEDKYIEK